MSAVSWGMFDEKENKALPIGAQIFVDKEIKPNDFILTRANTKQLIARSVVVQSDVRKKLLLNDKTLRFKFPKMIDDHYVNLYNNCVIAREHYESVSTGTSDSMQNISRENIKMLVFALPTEEEQQVIVEKVNQLMAYCDELETHVKLNQNHAEQLMQSVLREVFD